MTAPHPLLKIHYFTRGWILEPDDCPNDPGVYDWTVLAPDGMNSASLAFAIDVGTTSSDDEITIPESVMKALEALEAKLIEAGLY